VAAITFVLTLLAAPHLDKGILMGAGLAVLLYLWRTMRPRVAVLGRHPDGALRDVQVHPELPTSPEVLVLRFDDTLYFANAAFFESQVLDELAKKPGTRYLLIVASGINQMDASGDEALRHLVERLRAADIQVVICGVKKQVLDVMRRTDLDRLIGEANLYPNEERALAAIYAALGRDGRGELLPPAKA
jgi:SulP family sulfate permease